MEFQNDPPIFLCSDDMFPRIKKNINTILKHKQNAQIESNLEKNIWILVSIIDWCPTSHNMSISTLLYFALNALATRKISSQGLETNELSKSKLNTL